MPLNVPEIKRRREKLGITQTEAAHRAGFTIQRWHNIETGLRTAINPDALFAVARALECKMEDLVSKQK